MVERKNARKGDRASRFPAWPNRRTAAARRDPGHALCAGHSSGRRLHPGGLPACGSATDPCPPGHGAGAHRCARAAHGDGIGARHDGLHSGGNWAEQSRRPSCPGPENGTAKESTYEQGGRNALVIKYGGMSGGGAGSGPAQPGPGRAGGRTAGPGVGTGGRPDAGTATSRKNLGGFHRDLETPANRP